MFKISLLPRVARLLRFSATPPFSVNTLRTTFPTTTAIAERYAIAITAPSLLPLDSVSPNKVEGLAPILRATRKKMTVIRVCSMATKPALARSSSLSASSAISVSSV